jgi:hypothetical protein
MQPHDLIIAALERIHGILQRTLDGLSLEELHHQPRADANSIAWLVWHLTRVQDVSLSGIADEEQLWVTQGWHAKFARPADPKLDGFGHTPEDIAAFRVPSGQTLLDYHESVLERSKSYVAALTPEALDRELNEPQWQPLPTVGVRLVSVLSDNLQHAGQAAYLRGLIQGRGWLPY